MHFLVYTNPAERAEIKAWYEKKFEELYTKWYKGVYYYGSFEQWEDEARSSGCTTEEDIESFVINECEIAYAAVEKEVSWWEYDQRMNGKDEPEDNE